MADQKTIHEAVRENEGLTSSIEAEAKRIAETCSDDVARSAEELAQKFISESTSDERGLIDGFTPDQYKRELARKLAKTVSGLLRN